MCSMDRNMLLHETIKNGFGWCVTIYVPAAPFSRVGGGGKTSARLALQNSGHDWLCDRKRSNFVIYFSLLPLSVHVRP